MIPSTSVDPRHQHRWYLHDQLTLTQQNYKYRQREKHVSNNARSQAACSTYSNYNSHEALNQEGRHHPNQVTVVTGGGTTVVFSHEGGKREGESETSVTHEYVTRTRTSEQNLLEPIH